MRTAEGVSVWFCAELAALLEKTVGLGDLDPNLDSYHTCLPMLIWGTCVRTQRSTSGAHFTLLGPPTCFPLCGVSKAQKCTSWSTPEAEMVAASYALQNLGLPTRIFWDILMDCTTKLYVHEDNQAMIQVVRTGRNPTMRYLARTHGISVSWLHEVRTSDDVCLLYTQSADMAADIYTKAYTNAMK